MTKAKKVVLARSVDDRAIVIGCDCGWKSDAPSRRQVEVAIDEHRRLHCTRERICAICANVALGAMRELDVGQPAVFVCDDCHDEHPRSGRYGFDDSGEPSRVSDGQTPRRGP